jgi:hypothetical protein
MIITFGQGARCQIPRNAQAFVCRGFRATSMHGTTGRLWLAACDEPLTQKSNGTAAWMRKHQTPIPF